MDRKLNVVIVESRYHASIVDELYLGASQAFQEAYVGVNRLSVLESFELPQAMRMAIESSKIQGIGAVDSEGNALMRPDGYLILDCFLFEQGHHVDALYRSILRSVQDIACFYALPASLGIVMASSLEQAAKKASTKGHNKGSLAAHSCLKLIELSKKLGLTSGRIHAY